MNPILTTSPFLLTTIPSKEMQEMGFPFMDSLRELKLTLNKLQLINYGSVLQRISCCFVLRSDVAVEEMANCEDDWKYIAAEEEIDLQICLDDEAIVAMDEAAYFHYLSSVYLEALNQRQFHEIADFDSVRLLKDMKALLKIRPMNTAIAKTQFLFTAITGIGTKSDELMLQVSRLKQKLAENLTLFNYSATLENLTCCFVLMRDLTTNKTEHCKDSWTYLPEKNSFFIQICLDDEAVLNMEETACFDYLVKTYLKALDQKAFHKLEGLDSERFLKDIKALLQ